MLIRTLNNYLEHLSNWPTKKTEAIDKIWPKSGIFHFSKVTDDVFINRSRYEIEDQNRWASLAMSKLIHVTCHFIFVGPNFHTEALFVNKAIWSWAYYGSKIYSDSIQMTIMYFIILAFLAILLPTVCLSFTKLRFRWSFWGA